MTREVGLVAVAGEVNAVVDKYSGSRHPYLVISSVPRGGFSGGPVVSEYGFLLGVLTETLLIQGQPLEQGFTAALTVEPLWNLLADNRMFPASNGAFVQELLETEEDAKRILRSFPPTPDPETGGMVSVVPPSDLCHQCDLYRPLEDFQLFDGTISVLCSSCRKLNASS